MVAHRVDKAKTFAPERLFGFVGAFPEGRLDVVGDFCGFGSAGVAIGRKDGFGQLFNQRVLSRSKEARGFNGGGFRCGGRRQLLLSDFSNSGCGNERSAEHASGSLEPLAPVMPEINARPGFVPRGAPLKLLSAGQSFCARFIGLHGGSLKVAFLQFIGEVIAGAPAESHDGPGGVLATGVDEGAAIDNEESLDVVRLFELIEHRGFGVVTHAGGAEFVDGPAFGEDAVADMHDFETGGLEHFLGGFLHVASHVVFVVAKLIVKAQRGNSPLVLHNGIEVHVIFVARENFTESAHADIRALVFADFLLEGSAETMDIRTAREHRAAAAALEAVTTNELRMPLGEITKTGEIEASGATVIERGRLADETLLLAGDARAHDVLAEIVADMAAGIGKAIGMLP